MFILGEGKKTKIRYRTADGLPLRSAAQFLEALCDRSPRGIFLLSFLSLIVWNSLRRSLFCVCPPSCPQSGICERVCCEARIRKSPRLAQLVSSADLEVAAADLRVLGSARDQLDLPAALNELLRMLKYAPKIFEETRKLFSIEVTRPERVRSFSREGSGS